jgi:hypothetical protein
MTFGQVDPARLQGEALRRWYLRTPDEIEAERAATAEDAYKRFFSLPNSGAASDLDSAMKGTAAPASGRLTVGGASASFGPDQDYRVGGPEPLSSGAGGRASPYVQVAATSPGFWDYWSQRGCANCHGYTPGTLPPIGGHLPLPPGYSPRSGRSDRQGGTQPDRRDKRECEQQLESDTEICGRLPRRDDIAICRATASDRYAYCRRPDGTIGFPHLETRGGRRP